MGIFPKRGSEIIFRVVVVAAAWWSSCSAKRLPAVFVFGDSLVDVGNNNYLPTVTKANSIPNGIDFGRPTGRFTNGRTIVDIIGQEFGLKEFGRPYLDPTTAGSVILEGVNYASAGGGILNRSGMIYGARISMDEQLSYFANTKQEIISMIGEAAAMELIRNSLFPVVMGSNDFITNYLSPLVNHGDQSPEMFVDAMVSRFRIQLTRLYNMGARKIPVANVGPIGCVPYERDANPYAGDDCVALPNQLAQSFNSKLKNLVTELGHALKGSMFIYLDVYRIFANLLLNYSSYGFENGNSACCHVAGRFGGLIPCGPVSKVCVDRTKYVFWDPFHPSDASNVIIANLLINGGTDVATPINIRQLVNS
ncbi:hypothetical protein Nepgr_030393 [Nepenthes gracilis]|uniref:GDSL esterase/lipase n=1 Tax=Nepenthes gracilis TaxID=150966 RepID=A0AAD3TEI9_NEPGR|nr:hypothetical protein Nepgr_030393 [Nepenthes gracilis]